MLIRCPECGRTHGQKDSDSEGVSSNMCAKCYAAFYGDDLETLKDIFINEYLAPEERGEIVWQGPERVYTAEELVEYNKLLAEFRAESEINNGKRK